MATRLAQREYTRLSTFFMGFQEPVSMGGLRLHAVACTPTTNRNNSHAILNGQEGLGLHAETYWPLRDLLSPPLVLF